MAQKIYTEDDFQVLSAEEYLKRNPEIFFGSRGPHPEKIAGAISEGALILGAQTISVSQKDNWWYVCADLDWLSVPSLEGLDEASIFDRLWAFPESGDNSCRFEFIAKTFAEALFTVCNNQVNRLKGDLPSEESIRAQINLLGEWKRVVAFKFVIAA